MRGVKHPTEEARLEALREAQRRYDQTEKGRAKYARYRELVSGMEIAADQPK